MEVDPGYLDHANDEVSLRDDPRSFRNDLHCLAEKNTSLLNVFSFFRVESSVSAFPVASEHLNSFVYLRNYFKVRSNIGEEITI